MQKGIEDPPPKGVRPLIDEATARRVVRYLPVLTFANLLIGVPALLLSLTVAYFTFVHAEATEKMQIAAVWPYVQYVTSNLDESGDPRLQLALTNQGVGPARIGAMEIRYKNKPVSNARELLGSCCSDEPTEMTIGIGSVVDEIIRPGETATFLQLDPEGGTPEEYARLSEARFQIDVRTFFCSVFDDCSVIDWTKRKPQPVARCPGGWQLFGSTR